MDLFSHAAHVGQGMACADCHGPVEALMAAAKSECRSCHVTQTGLSDCSLCHSDGADYVPDNHGGGWESWHGVEAGAISADCSNCHAQNDCQQCHVGDNVDPRVHPLGFELSHALEARMSTVDCAVCHEEPQFCVSCHASAQVLPWNHSFADWVLGSGDGGRHGLEASLDLESCIACHAAGDGDPLCADCHGR